jgi:hypothetical protein
MRQVWMLAGTALLLAGCGDEVSPEEQTAANERDVAIVEAANKVAPPVQLITPEPILLPDIERYDLLGEACSYAPGTSLGARVIAREADAFMKLDGEIERFAADPGARELPMHTRSVYNSKGYSLVLGLKEDTGEDGERTSYEGSVTLRDEHGRVIYEGVGEAQCIAG